MSDRNLEALLRQAALTDAFADKDAEHGAELAGYRARQDTLLSGITEALDSLERVAAEPSAERLGLIARQLTTAVQLANCAVIGKVGELADPATHQVMETVDAGGQPDDTVVVVVSRGYRSPDRVVPAKVIVTVAGAETTDQIDHEERE